jgi:hypothetical protein
VDPNLSAAQFGIGPLGSYGQPSVMGAGNQSFPAAGVTGSDSLGMGGSS